MSKDTRIYIRLTSAEKKALQEMAKKARLSISEFVRNSLGLAEKGGQEVGRQ